MRALDSRKNGDRGEGLGEVFEVFDQTAVAAAPGKGSLVDLSLWRHEAFHVIGAFDDLSQGAGDLATASTT